MSSEEIRESFLKFFEVKGHKIVPSSSLIPDDPSVLLTTAGMQQFKRYYTGELNALVDFGSQRTASCQKCFRTSDLEEIGDKIHLTFLEMLGNFSFGPVGTDNPEDFSTNGYFKRSAIHWAYEFMTGILEIPAQRIRVSVFGGDNEVPFDEVSYKIWHEEIGILEDKIMMGNRADNFWGPTGDEGPCGPNTEIYVDGVEVWNLVFNEYYQTRNARGSDQRVIRGSLADQRESALIKLDNPGVDTGMGFERLIAVLQGVDNVFETDIFRDLVSKINELAPNLDDRTVRIIADHLRASIFLIAEGIRPSNKETGYILRRLLRRILAYAVKYDIHADLFPASVEIIKEKFGDIYLEVKEAEIILEVLENEKQKFQEAIGRGIKEIEKYSEITGKEAFYLYESFGLPFELIKELAPKEVVKNLSKKDFDKEFEKHQEISRAGVEKKFGGHGIEDIKNQKAKSKMTKLHTATHLLHFALREVLGEEIKQMGSDINPERLRFDFSFNRKITSQEIQKVEDLVNQKIKEDLSVYFKEMPKLEAEKTGALHFFKEKYPEIVKVYFIGPVSAEFCAGPHVEKTSEIGGFKILKEEALGTGIRRIRATIC